MVPQPSATDVYSSNRAAQHQPTGKSAAYRTGVALFFKSLHPGYLSESAQVEYPTFCADSSDQQCQTLSPRTELAARVICTYAGLPTAVVSYVNSLANISAAIRWVESKCIELVTGRNVQEEHAGAGIKRWEKQNCVTSCRPARLSKPVVAVGAVSCLGTVGAKTQWIEVNNTETLGKIGHDPAYPLDGHYRQVAHIDARGLPGPIGNESHPFVGEYDGRCKMIHHLDHCFVKKLDGNGRIYNQIYLKARIVSDEQAGVVACQMSGKSALSRIIVQESSVTTNKDNTPAGFATGVAGNNTVIDGFNVVGPATVETRQKESHAGLVAGDVHGIINNTRSLYGKVKTFERGSMAGSVAGRTKGVINNTVNILASVSTLQDQAYAGGGAGHALEGAVIDKTVLVSCKLTSYGYRSSIGGGAGVVEESATVSDTLLTDTYLRTHGEDADAAAGGGFVRGSVTTTTMVEGEVLTHGVDAQAAVGGGQVYYGLVDKTTGRDATIKTTGSSGDAGVGAGKVLVGAVSQTSCYNSKIVTADSTAFAGVGGGDVVGSVGEVVSIKCNVTTSGKGSNAGLGAGLGEADKVTAMYSKVEATGKKATVARDKDFFDCSTSVGKSTSRPCCDQDHNESCISIPAESCRYADLRVLTAWCDPLPPPYFDSGRGGGFICPTGSTERSLNVTGTPVVNVSEIFPTTPLLLSGSGSAPNIAVVVGITLGLVGAAALIGIGGTAIYRHYFNRGEQKTESDGIHDL